MPNGSAFDANSPAVMAHINLMQGVIQRMADNSRSCKLWCVTIAAAVLVFAARSDYAGAGYALIALLPVVALLFLDAYYLALERGFRASYKAFADKLHAGKLDASDLYAVDAAGPPWRRFAGCLASPSTWLFYLTIGTAAIALWLLATP